MKKLEVVYQQHLRVDIDINTICQYNCPYCYARKSFKWNQMMRRSMMESILDGLCKRTTPIRVSILGGEPTLHPLLRWFVERLLEIKQVKECAIVTNAAKEPPPIDDPRFFIMPTWHPLEADDGLFLEYVRKYRGRIISPVVIMLPKYADRAQYIISELINQFSIHPSPTPIRVNGHVIPYNVSVDDDEERCYRFNGREWTFNELVKNGLNRFNGWRCLALNYSIGVDGSVGMACHTLGKPNLTDFLANIKPMWITCEHETCIDDCLVETPKYKGNLDRAYEAKIIQDLG